MPDDETFNGTFSVQGEMQLENVDFDTLYRLMNPERIPEPDAAIYALMALLHDYKKPLRMTGDAMRMVKENRKLKMEHDKKTDLYTFYLS